MIEQGNTIVVILQADQADWYYRNQHRFMNALVTRMHSGETDRYPGYSRYDGDGVPGMQIVWNESSEKLGIICVGSGSGHKVAYMNNTTNKKSKGLHVSILKVLAQKLGYDLVEKKEAKNGDKRKNNT